MVLMGKPEGEGHFEYLRIEERIILKYILKKYSGRVRAGFIWFRTGTSRGLF
jgi:hypothetical protein